MAITNYYAVDSDILGEKTTASSRIDYLTDALGSVTATLNQSAQVVNTYRYKPYGAQLAKTGTAADPAFTWVGAQGYRQTGRKYSDVYVRARHYSTALALWSTQDPLWPAEAAFAYALDNPITWYDGSGLNPTPPSDDGPPVGWPGPQDPKKPWTGPSGPPGTCFSPKPCKSHECQKDPCGFRPPPMDRKGNQFGGWVVCCNGFAYPCVNRNTAGNQPGVIYCIQQHEACHIKQLLKGDLSCPACGFGYASYPTDAIGHRSECECAAVEISCLISHMKVCARLSGKAQKQCYDDYKIQLRSECQYSHDQCAKKADVPKVCNGYKK